MDWSGGPPGPRELLDPRAKPGVQLTEDPTKESSTEDLVELSMEASTEDLVKLSMESSTEDLVELSMASSAQDLVEPSTESSQSSSAISSKPSLGFQDPEAWKKRTDQSFGMSRKDLEWSRAGLKRKHDLYSQAAEARFQRKRKSKRYQFQEISVTSADGSEKVADWVLVRRPDKLTRVQRYNKWQSETGRKVQNGLNIIGAHVRKAAGRPRKSGSNYATNKAKDDLLVGGKTFMGNVPNTVVNSGEVGNTLYNGQAGLEGGVTGGPADECLGMVSLLANGIDGLLVAEPFARILSAKQIAEDTLQRENKLFQYFLRFLDKATPQEAESFLLMIEAAEKAVDLSQEDKSILKTAKDRFWRVAGVLPFVNANGVGGGIANTAAGMSADAVGALIGVGGALGVVAGGIDIDEATHELLRRRSATAQARARKEGCDRVMAHVDRNQTDTLAGDEPPLQKLDQEEYGLLTGLLEGIKKSQDVLIKDSRREKKYAKAQAGKAGATVGLGVGSLAVAGVVTSGVLAAPTFGLSLIPGAVAGAAWAGALTKRDLERKAFETRSKGLQRAAVALGNAYTREELEAMVRDNKPVTVTYGQGEYLAEDERFAGDCVVSFQARDNEYLILRLLACQLQDIVQLSSYRADSPFVQILHEALGINPLKLLAIMKVASTKRGEAQLDYLQSKLAPAMGMKFRTVNGRQARPHPKFFIDRFKEALGDLQAKIRVRHKHPNIVVRWDESHFEDIRAELQASLRGEEGMVAFKESIDEFLEKTGSLPNPAAGDRAQMRKFMRWLQERPDDAIDSASPQVAPLRKAESRDRPLPLAESSSDDLGRHILIGRRDRPAQEVSEVVSESIVETKEPKAADAALLRDIDELVKQIEKQDRSRHLLDRLHKRRQEPARGDVGHLASP